MQYNNSCDEFFEKLGEIKMNIGKERMVNQELTDNNEILEFLCQKSMVIKKMNLSLSKTVLVKNSKSLRSILSGNNIKAVRKTIEQLCKKGYEDQAKKLLMDVLNAKDNRGKFFELMVYYWLLKIQWDFEPQSYVSKDNCYKEKADGYEADGLIKDLDCIFDVKEFGILFPRIDDFKNKLQNEIDKILLVRIKEYIEEKSIEKKHLKDELNCLTDQKDKKCKLDQVKLIDQYIERMLQEMTNGLWNYSVYIEGVHNASINELQEFGLEKVEQISNEIVDNIWNDRMEKWNKIDNWNSNNDIIKYGNLLFCKQIKELGLEIKVYSPRSSKYNGGMIGIISQCNPYEWAKNNESYFIKDCSQFVINKPYFLICAYDKNTSGLFLHDSKKNDQYFRPLCRRVFMNLNKKTDQDTAKSYDGKARKGVTTAEVSKKLTGIIFLDISNITDSEVYSTSAWVYLNPNADNELKSYEKNKFQLIGGAQLDDFEYDNY